jgi:hypothetical protein
MSWRVSVLSIRRRIMNKKRIASLLAMLVVLMSSAFMPARADYRDYYPYHNQSGSYFYDHPYVQKAVIGGGAGAVIGAIAGGDGNRVNTAVKGALLGAGAGLGYEYLRQKGIFNW